MIGSFILFKERKLILINLNSKKAHLKSKMSGGKSEDPEVNPELREAFNFLYGDV